MAKAPENFAETVKEVRRQLGLSQEELAHELGVSFSTVNHRDPQELMAEYQQIVHQLTAVQQALKTELMACLSADKRGMA